MKMIKKLVEKISKRRDGYLTIELTLVFSVLFFSLLLILFLGIVLYQRVNLQSLAIQASERGSIIYSSRTEDMTTGEKTLADFKIRNPYRNLPGFSLLADDDYEATVNKYISSNIGQRDILAGNNKNNGSYATVENFFFSKRLQVEINTDYELPVASIGEMFGHSGPFNAYTVTESAIVDSPDFVRTVDLVMDITKQTEVFEKVEDGFNNVMEYIEKLQEYLKKDDSGE